jgi:hypothetical protein
VCQHLGLPSSSTKPVLQEALQSVSAPSNINATTLSIDLGIRNLAFCQLAPDSTVVKWDRVTLPLPGGGVVPKIVLPTYAEAAISLKESLPFTDEILIEHQRWRSGGARSVLPITVAVNTMEAMLHVVFLGTAVCVEPAAIAKTWDLVGGKERKKEKIEMVRKLLRSGEVKGSLGAWDDNNKKDDLSDCLIQALTWKRWMLNRTRWVNGEWPVGLESLDGELLEPKPARRSRKANEISQLRSDATVMTHDVGENGHRSRKKRPSDLTSLPVSVELSLVQFSNGVSCESQITGTSLPSAVSPLQKGRSRKQPADSEHLAVSATQVSISNREAAQVERSSSMEPLPKESERPGKQVRADADQTDPTIPRPTEDSSSLDTLPKKRGRPKKQIRTGTEVELEPRMAAPAEGSSATESPPKKQGRSREQVRSEDEKNGFPPTAPVETPSVEPLAKRRGRPRKIPSVQIPEEKTNEPY